MSLSDEVLENESETRFRLVVLRSGNRGRVYPLHEGNNLIGRWDPETGSFPEIDLEGEDDEAKVSRKHAVIEWSGDKITLEDLGSLNGTYINRGSKLKAGERYEISPGDELIVGKTFLKFESD